MVAITLKQAAGGETIASTWTYAAAGSGIVNTTTAVTIRAAQPGLRNFVTGLTISTATLGGATEFAIRDGAGGTVLYRTVFNTTALPVTCIHFEAPIVGTTNTLLEIVTLTAVTGGVYVNVNGFTAT